MVVGIGASEQRSEKERAAFLRHSSISILMIRELCCSIWRAPTGHFGRQTEASQPVGRPAGWQIWRSITSLGLRPARPKWSEAAAKRSRPPAATEPRPKLIGLETSGQSGGRLNERAGGRAGGGRAKISLRGCKSSALAGRRRRARTLIELRPL